MRDLSSPSSPPAAQNPRISSSISLRRTPLWSMPGDLFLVEEVATDDVTDGLAGDTGRGLVHDPELGTEHPSLASPVDSAKSKLPESPTGG